MNKFILIILFFLIGCGYQPVYLSKNIEKFEFSEVILGGDGSINRKIINTLLIKETKKNTDEKLYLTSSLKNESTSKDTIGQSVSFRTTLDIILKVENADKKITEEKKFTKEFSYNNKSNKSKLVEYQDSIKKDLVNQIVSEIAIYLNSK